MKTLTQEQIHAIRLIWQAEESEANKLFVLAIESMKRALMHIHHINYDNYVVIDNDGGIDCRGYEYHEYKGDA